jgi:N-sulfoglucosamine sulfohydrolase
MNRTAQFTLATLLLVPLAALHAADTSAKPNILFIYVEDIGYYTSERAAREPNARIAGLKTPNLDSLAAGGVNFTRTFCGQSVCSPSKSAIYSGLLPHMNGIWRNCHNNHPKLGNPDKWIPLPNPITKENDPTNLAAGGMHEGLTNLVQMLKAKGVYCALSGKLHQQPARNFPYDGFFGTSDLDAVIKAAGDKPWFFWCNPGDTHAPWWRHVQDKLVNPKDRNSAPKDVDPAAIQMLPWLPDTPATRIDIAQYYSCVRIIDAFVGEMLKKLEASGQADHTIVVFTGDHGIPCARGKTSVYPAGTHVPCYIKGPGIKTGRVLTTPISQMDFNPTFLEAFGIAPQPVCHGKSLWPILSGKVDALPDRTTIMTETNGGLASAPKGQKPTKARAVCDGRYYYVGNVYQDTFKGPVEKAISIGSGNGEYGDPGPQYSIDLHDEAVRHKDDQPLPYELLRQLCMADAPREELYDLDADPWAVKNLVNDPAHAATLARLRKEFANWRAFTKDNNEPFALKGAKVIAK